MGQSVSQSTPIFFSSFFLLPNFFQVKSVSEQLDILITRIQSEHKIDDLLPVIIYKTNELNTSFIYSQLLFDCLLQMPTNDENEFLSLCKTEYKDNENELNIIREFEENYSANQALSWYTRKSFIYRILNKALRIQNIRLLFIFKIFSSGYCLSIKTLPLYLSLFVFIVII